MKSVTAMIFALAFAAFLTGPVQAQETPQADAPVTRTDTAEPRDDDSGRWGLIGLAGLAGLAGLMRRPQPEVRTVERVDSTRIDGTR
jgi:MYXO-CTERM domain-containing protein